MFTTLPEVAWTGPFRNAVRVGLDCSRGIEHTVQVLAAHCVLKQSSDIVASPGIVLAPALSRHTHRHTHTHTHMHAHAHTYTNTNARANTLRRAHTHTHAHTHKHTCTRAHTYTRTNTQAHTRAHTHTHSHTHTHTHTHMHMHAHVVRVMGFANFSASLATLPHCLFHGLQSIALCALVVLVVSCVLRQIDCCFDFGPCH